MLKLALSNRVKIPDARNETAVFRQRLQALMKEEEDIERAREALNYEQRVREVAKKAGY
jgi:hypothetical protein